MVEETNAHYEVPESKKKTFEKLYNEFTRQYSIKLSKGAGGLIITESFDGNGINITSENINGKVLAIYALKPASELETKLTKNDLLSGFSIFKTKDSKTIVIQHK